MRGIAVCVLALGLAACAKPTPPPSTPRLQRCSPLPASQLRPLSRDAAREAHRRAAWQRSLRFREQVTPGALLRDTAAALGARPAEHFCLDDLAEIGGLLFTHDFGFADGLGTPAQKGFRRVQQGEAGGPDANACASCHWRGGIAGAGARQDNAYFHGDGDRLSSADARNPPALQGVGVVQALAAEMSADLQRLRDKLVAASSGASEAREIALQSKGVSFGTLRAGPDGALDFSRVEGVDPDLVIKPFGWKGNFATLRDFVKTSLRQHLGIEGEELSAAQRLSLIAFLATQEMPEIRLPAVLDDMPPSAPGFLPPSPKDFSGLWSKGRQHFLDLGCAGCHRSSLRLNDPVFRTRYQGRTVEIDLREALGPPALQRDGEGYRVWLFSDMKRHDMGAESASRHRDRGVAERDYLTRRLWGLADSPPWYYDGRAPDLDAAIAAHGGEGDAARSAFELLSGVEKGALRVYLMSLRRPRRLQIP